MYNVEALLLEIKTEEYEKFCVALRNKKFKIQSLRQIPIR
jgi:hypothetical protein